MIFAYQRDLDGLKRKNPFLQFGVAPVPQTSLEQKISYPFYEGLAVSKQSKNASWGWDFAVFAATNDAGQSAYLAESKRPPALRSRIASLENDADLGVFASQALVAQSWYMTDPDGIATLFAVAIQDALSGRVEAVRALEQAEDKVSQLMRR